jgi:hypothetical protein
MTQVASLDGDSSPISAQPIEGAPLASGIWQAGDTAHFPFTQVPEYARITDVSQNGLDFCRQR